MSQIITMPKLGLTMNSGVISRWLKKEGDYVKAGEIIVEIETDKINSEVESPVDGFILKIFAEEGSEKEIRAPLCEIGEKNGSVNINDGTKFESGENKIGGRIFISPIAKKLAGENGIDYSQIKGTGPEGRIVKKDILNAVEEKGGSNSKRAQHTSDESQRISPLAKKIAQDNGVDYRGIRGMGPEGKIVKEDIIAAAERDKLQGNMGRTVPLSGIRRAIAQKLSQSKHDIPHTYFKICADVGKAIELKNRVSDAITARTGKKPTLNDIIIKAAALALESYSDINASLIDNNIIYHDDINIGIAVNIEKGLIVPVVRNANLRSLSEICRITAELIEKARTGKLSQKDVTGGTFTVSNLGAYRIDEFCAIINPPESAILAVGAAKEAPFVENGQLVVKTMMTLTISVDHRVIDGAHAALFLKKLKDTLEDPYTLLV